MRENKTRYAILGMLSRKDMSGYDIRKTLQAGMHTFWSESNGQIYPIMKGLAAAGLARKSVERQEGRPDRHVYTITESGREELRDWLNRPTEAPRYRLEFLLKLIFGYETSIDRNIQHLETLRSQQMEDMAEFETIEAHLRSEPLAGTPRAHYGLASLHCGIRATQAFIDWIDDEIASLTELRAAQQRKEQDQ